jgi:hypothetical protein
MLLRQKQKSLTISCNVSGLSFNKNTDNPVLRGRALIAPLVSSNSSFGTKKTSFKIRDLYEEV